MKPTRGDDHDLHSRQMPRTSTEDPRWLFARAKFKAHRIRAGVLDRRVEPWRHTGSARRQRRRRDQAVDAGDTALRRRQVSVGARRDEQNDPPADWT